MDCVFILFGVPVLLGLFLGTDALPIGDADHDLLAAVAAWVEHGHPPERIVASKLEDGRVTAQHPVCAYPAEAVYKGGSPTQAASYACGRLHQAALD